MGKFVTPKTFMRSFVGLSIWCDSLSIYRADVGWWLWASGGGRIAPAGADDDDKEVGEVDGEEPNDVDMEGGREDTADAATAVHCAPAASASDEAGVEALSPLQLELLACVREHLLPVLSLTGANVALVNELWEFLKDLSWKLRYSLYSSWRYTLLLCARVCGYALSRVCGVCACLRP